MSYLVSHNKSALTCYFFRPVIGLVTFLILTFSLSAASAPIVLEFDSCSKVEIDGRSLNESLIDAREALSEDELVVFQTRRKEILKKVLVSGKKHMFLFGLAASIKSCFKGKPKSPKRLAKESLLNALTVVDKVIWENASHIANCNQWGVCTQFGAHFVIGFKRWTTGIGTYLGIDRIKIYDKNDKAYADYFIEMNYPYYAHTPSFDLSANIRFTLHFDNGHKNTNKALELKVFPVAPIAYAGDNSIGFGIHTGVSLPPWVGAWASHSNKVLRLSCSDLLKKIKAD